MHDFNHQISGDTLGARHSNPEMARAIRLAAAGWDSSGGGLFATKMNWSEWLTGSFEKMAGPHFAQVFTLAGQMKAREIAELDAAFDAGNAGARCRTSGAALMQCLLTAKSSRLAQKLANTCESPLLPTAAAVQTVEFHLPIQQALLTYLFFEAHGASSKCGIDAFLLQSDAAAASINRVISFSFGNFRNAFSS